MKSKKHLFFILISLLITLASCSSIQNNTSGEDSDPSSSSNLVVAEIGENLSDEYLNFEQIVYIQLTSPTPDVKIYYSFDLSDELDEFTLYTDPFPLPSTLQGNVSEHLRTYLVYPSDEESPVYTKNFYNNSEIIFSPAQGYFESDIEVSLSTEEDNQTIYYSFDENTPTKDFLIYDTPILLQGSKEEGISYTIRAYAVDETNSTSNVFTKEYYVYYPPSKTPLASADSAIYSTSFSLTFTNKAEGSTIYYTLDGTTPNTTSLMYNENTGISIGEGITTITAIQVESQHRDSKVGHYSFKVDPNFVEDYSYATLSFQNIVDQFVGTWIGTRYTPWFSPQSAHFIFREDGTYSSYSSPGSTKEGISSALYYGTDKDSPNKTYEINNMDLLGRGSGEIQVVFGVGTTNISEIKKIRFSENLDVLEFEYWHRGQYGPVIFKLYRF